MERTRVWRGMVKPEARAEHERFVAWLGTGEAKSQFAKFLLTSYMLAQEDDQLTITMGAEEPVPLIRFLRNRRMWPDFWEFTEAGADSGVDPGAVRVSWRRGETK